MKATKLELIARAMGLQALNTNLHNTCGDIMSLSINPACNLGDNSSASIRILGDNSNLGDYKATPIRMTA